MCGIARDLHRCGQSIPNARRSASRGTTDAITQTKGSASEEFRYTLRHSHLAALVRGQTFLRGFHGREGLQQHVHFGRFQQGIDPLVDPGKQELAAPLFC
jgi:hypothetical protein